LFITIHPLILQDIPSLENIEKSIKCVFLVQCVASSMNILYACRESCFLSIGCFM